MAADQIDNANEMADAYIESAISAARVTNKNSRLVAKGACHNCDEPLPCPGQLFCDSDCSEDYEYVQSRKRANRISV